MDEPLMPSVQPRAVADREPVIDIGNLLEIDFRVWPFAGGVQGTAAEQQIRLRVDVDGNITLIDETEREIRGACRQLRTRPTRTWPRPLGRNSRLPSARLRGDLAVAKW